MLGLLVAPQVSFAFNGLSIPKSTRSVSTPSVSMAAGDPAEVQSQIETLKQQLERILS